MNKLPMIARLLLGAIFFVFGLNGFFSFIPVPEMPEPANRLIGALVDSGYLMSLVKLVEVVCGILLLVGRYVPLALTLLAPIVVNIVAFHLFLAPGAQGLALPLLALVLGIYLAYSYRASFKGVLAMDAQPG